MQTTTFIDTAKIMSKGQVTIPKDIRNILKLSVGDRLSFIVENNEVRIENSAAYAMKRFQSEMEGAAAEASLSSEEDVMDLITQMRNEE